MLQQKLFTANNLFSFFKERIENKQKAARWKMKCCLLYFRNMHKSHARLNIALSDAHPHTCT